MVRVEIKKALYGGKKTRWGLATTADKPEGPYVRNDYNPVTNSGYETCLWKYKGRMSALLRTDGVEKNTIQYDEDGVNFKTKAVKNGSTEALGSYRDEETDSADYLGGTCWGLCHKVRGIKGSEWGYIRRFNIDE